MLRFEFRWSMSCRLVIMLTSRLVPGCGKLQRRYLSKSASKFTNNENHDLTKIRNIGILAHIDAGKTTTTERMLYYSGLIKFMGEVHHGNTVTDYMDQERERGITITSAAVTFDWKNHRINLIDTPGHIDFTMQVEQSIRVLDGAVVILDGSAGVEAQTLTVCKQADKYHIPRIIYVNKMDKQNANFDMCIKSIQSKLRVPALPIHFPIKHKGVLKGIVDVISTEKLIFDTKAMGMKYTRSKLSESEDEELWVKAMEKRRSLTDKLSNIDDKLAEVIIEQESLDTISPQLLHDSLYRSTINRKGVIVLSGSSYKNMGVQLLMDSVLLYLPSPKENKYSKCYNCFGENLSARVFKIVHDKQRGPITFVRIYTGSLNKNTIIYNVTRREREQMNRLYVVCADEYKEVSMITSGNVGAVAGLKTTMTGDLITTDSKVVHKAKEAFKRLNNVTKYSYEPPFDIFESESKALEPVFFCSIEAPSLSTQPALDTALKQLEREDPSLQVKYNEETDQTVLGGMGELHIEVIKERIKSEYKIDADVGPLQIAYKETIKRSITDTFTYEHKLGNVHGTVMVKMSVIPNFNQANKFMLDKSPNNDGNLKALLPTEIKAIRSGINSVFSCGPKLGFPVINTGVKLHSFEKGKGTVPTIIIAAVSQCLKKILRDAEIMLMEPVMKVEIAVPTEYFSPIVKDLAKRRAEILGFNTHTGNMCSTHVINCYVPLAELIGYSTAIRIISSGHATFTLEFDHYELLDSKHEAEAVKRVTGFY